MSDVLVYTAIFGKRDFVKIPKELGFDWRFVTDDEDFTDVPGAIVTPPPLAGDPRRSARLLKVLPHLFFPKYHRWIWLDGSASLRADVTAGFLQQVPGPLATFRHREKDCAYHEAADCIKNDLDYELVIRMQVEGYRKEGFPEHHGLAETQVVVRDNNPRVREFNRRWWTEVSTKSVRDQISFNYVAWKLGMPVHYMGRCTGTDWFRMGPHLP